MTPWYTDQEIDDLCVGLINNAAKVRYLRAQGLTVNQKPNGRPLVMRAHAEAVLSGLKQILTEAVPVKQPNRPNPEALIAMFGGKHKKAR
jgi:hypothetical protein